MPDPSPSTMTVLNSNFLQLGRRSGGRPQRTIYPRRLPVSTVMHTTLAGIEPTTFRLLVRCATSSATDSPNIICFDGYWTWSWLVHKVTTVMQWTMAVAIFAVSRIITAAVSSTSVAPSAFIVARSLVKIVYSLWLNYKMLTCFHK